MKINAAACGFVVVWCVGSAVLSAGGVFRHWGLTLNQGVVVQVGWAPVMLASMFLLIARNAHMLAWLDSQRDRMQAMEEGLAETMGAAIHEAVSRAMAGEEPPAGQKGPTIQ
jgi:hypothetical protein